MHPIPLLFIRELLFTRVLCVAHRHDEIPQFRLWYAVAVITAGVIFNLGIFTVLVAAHMALDVIKYRTKHRLNWYWTCVETVRESLIDVFFIVFGLFLAITVHHAFAIGGLGSLARAETLLFGLILRIGPRIKIAEDIMKVIMHWKHHFTILHFHPREPLSKGETVLCAATLVLVVIMLTLPLTTPLTWKSLFETFSHELTPRMEMGITETISIVSGA